MLILKASALQMRMDRVQPAVRMRLSSTVVGDLAVPPENPQRQLAGSVAGSIQARNIEETL